MKKTNYNHAPFKMPEWTLPNFPENQFCCSDFSSIQEAIDYCTSLGGGTVVVPPGDWYCGSLHLTSNLHLMFSEGSVIHFSDAPEDYLPVVFTRWEGTECYNYSPLIYARGCQNIAVTGCGTLLGNGERWWNWKTCQQDAANTLGYSQYNHISPENRIFGTPEHALRPSFLQFIDCKNILIDGITLIDGPQWTIHPVYCENILIRNTHVRTSGPNTDGLNPDSCRNVLIENCDFCTGDDCIAINSGLNEDGWRVNRPSENIVIRNCTMTGGHGGLVIGSAISGGARNIYAHDCSISGTMQGIRLKSMRGRGGTVENITFDNITINDVSHEAIQINMFYEYSTIVPKTNTPSTFRNIMLSNISGKGAKTAVALTGLPEKHLQHIVFEDICLFAETSFICSNVSDLQMNQVHI